MIEKGRFDGVMRQIARKTAQKPLKRNFLCRKEQEVRCHSGGDRQDCHNRVKDFHAALSVALGKEPPKESKGGGKQLYNRGKNKEDKAKSNKDRFFLFGCQKEQLKKQGGGKSGGCEVKKCRNDGKGIIALHGVLPSFLIQYTLFLQKGQPSAFFSVGSFDRLTAAVCNW